MKILKLLQGCTVALASLGIIAPQAIYAAQPAANQVQTAIKDIALQNGNTLQGFVVDGAGTPLASADVLVATNGQVVANVKTDANGAFAVSGLNGGVYQLQTANGVATFRMWAANTAPPVAYQAAMIVSDKEIARGQNNNRRHTLKKHHGGHAKGGLFGGNGGVLGALANPWVLAGIVAVAVALPIALDDDDAS